MTSDSKPQASEKAAAQKAAAGEEAAAAKAAAAEQAASTKAAKEAAAAAKAEEHLPKLEDLAERMKKAGPPPAGLVEKLNEQLAERRKSNEMVMQVFLVNLAINSEVREAFMPLVGTLAEKTEMTKIFAEWGLEKGASD